MNDSPIEPLDPKIAELFARERMSHEASPTLKEAVLSKVHLAVALRDATVGASLAAKGTKAALAAKAVVSARAAVAIGLAAFATGAAGGGLAVRSALEASRPVPTAAPSASAIVGPVAPAPSASDEAAVPDVAPPPSASASASAAPTASAVVAPSASSAPGDLTLEREILDIAHAALARGRPSDALAAANRHAREWPRGYLGEEREAVVVQALAASGKGAEARARFERFRARFPKSMLVPALEAVTGAREKGDSEKK